MYYKEPVVHRKKFKSTLPPLTPIIEEESTKGSEKKEEKEEKEEKE